MPYYWIFNGNCEPLARTPEGNYIPASEENAPHTFTTSREGAKIREKLNDPKRTDTLSGIRPFSLLRVGVL